MKFEVGGPPSQEWSGSSAELVEMAQLADSVGLDRFGVSDHRFAFECVTLMSACLVGTKQIIVESLVMDPFKRHPLVTGCAMTTMADPIGWQGGPRNGWWRREAVVLARGQEQAARRDKGGADDYQKALERRDCRL